MMGVPCRVRGQFDLGRHSLEAKVPRSCLANPAWVRVGVKVSYTEGTQLVGAAEWTDGTDTDPWLPPYGPTVPAAPGALVTG